jgi:hypothetical protein
MNCNDAHARLLEADPATLEGQDGSPLATHLHSCAACRARAQAILRGESLLARELARDVPVPDLEAILTKAEEENEVPTLPFFTRRVRMAPWSRAGALVPLAAAAVMAALMLGRTPSLPGPEFTPEPIPPGLEVEIPEGQDVAVLATSNPDITVLWHF